MKRKKPKKPKKSVASKPKHAPKPSDGKAAPTIARAIELHKSGNLSEARQIYLDVLESQPEHVDALQNMGAIAGVGGELEEAREYFEKVVALKPDSIEAINNMGSVCRDLGDMEGAETYYKRALELAPKDERIMFGLGMALNGQKKFLEALRVFNTLVENKPFSAPHWVQQGIALMNLDRAEEAIGSFEKALEIDPTCYYALRYIGACNTLLGRKKEAVSYYKKSLEMKSDDPVVYASLLQAADDVDDIKPLISRIENLLAAGIENKDKLVALRFALAQGHDSLGDKDKSLEQIRIGSEEKRSNFDYEFSNEEKILDRIAAVFTRDFIIRHAGKGCPSDRPIFIVGMPRSGSTLLEQILVSHPRVAGLGESHMIPNMVKSLKSSSRPGLVYPEVLEAATAQEFALLGEQYLAAASEAVEAPGSKITDKMLANLWHVGLIHLMLPSAKFVHVVRNPVDNCFSCYRQNFFEGHPWSFDLDELGKYYRLYRRVMAHWQEVLPSGFFLEVAYENIVADHETETRRILEFCDLEWDDACLDFHQTERVVRTASVMQVRSPIYTSSVAKWKKYEKYLGPLLESLGDDIIRESQPLV